MAQLRVFLSYHTPDRAIALGLKSAIEEAIKERDSKKDTPPVPADANTPAAATPVTQ